MPQGALKLQANGSVGQMASGAAVQYPDDADTSCCCACVCPCLPDPVDPADPPDGYPTSVLISGTYSVNIPDDPGPGDTVTGTCDFSVTVGRAPTADSDVLDKCKFSNNASGAVHHDFECPTGVFWSVNVDHVVETVDDVTVCKFAVYFTGSNANTGETYNAAYTMFIVKCSPLGAYPDQYLSILGTDTVGGTPSTTYYHVANLVVS